MPYALFMEGSFNYLDQSLESSLRSNGRVFTRRDRDGSDAGTEGVVIESHVQRVDDGRQLEGAENCTLDRSGFELLASPRGDSSLNFFDLEPVVEHYYGDCAALVQEATSARDVYAFDHNVRSADGKKTRRRLAGGQEVQAPARIVHGDYTLMSAPQRVLDLTQPPGHNDTLRGMLDDGESLVSQAQHERVAQGARFALINVWRNISEGPVMRDPIAFCDAQSVDPDDLVVFEIRYHDRVGENYFAKHADRHRWVFYPEMTRDEVVLIKQWDSAGKLAHSEGRQADSSASESPCTFSFHSAFFDAKTPEDAPARWSIEVRCMAFFD